MKTTLLAATAALMLGSLTMASPANARDSARSEKPVKQDNCITDKKDKLQICSLDDPISGFRLVSFGDRPKKGAQNNHHASFIMPLLPDGSDVQRNEAGVPIILANPTSAMANWESKLADIPGQVLGGFANGGLSTLVCVLGKCNRNNGTGVNNFIATQANAASVADVDVALANAIAVSPAGTPGGCPPSSTCPYGFKP